MEIEKKINDFAELGTFLAQFGTTDSKKRELNRLNNLFYDRFEELIKKQYQYNGWFTEDNVRLAISALSEMLKKNELEKWTGAYKSELGKKKNPKKVAVIMAGNIPLVGFHD